jgi:hypothetical protein
MEQVRRWDAGTVNKVERTNQGYLRCDALITKTGVFAYRQAGGTVRRELRLPEEVFKTDALGSFALAPLTNGHPPVMLTARNTAKYQVGSVVEPKMDGDHVAAFVQITDADAIEAAEAGRRQLSCGYTCNLETRSGVTQGIAGVPDGLHYDAIQRDIRGNHVALVDTARAGSTVQLRIDQADAFQVETDEQWRYDRDPATIQGLIFDPAKFDAKQAAKWSTDHGFSVPNGVDSDDDGLSVMERDASQFEADSFRVIDLNPGIMAVIGRPTKTDSQDMAIPAKRGKHMEPKITIDGVTYDVSEQVAQAVGKLSSRVDELTAGLADLKKQHESERARADAAEEALSAEKKARTDAESPDKLRQAVDARLKLERVAAPILGDQVKLDEMTDPEIKAAVVVAAAKDKDLAKERIDGCGEEYLQARFDAAVESWEQSSKPNEGLKAVRQGSRDTQRTDSDSARERMMAHHQELGRKAFN